MSRWASRTSNQVHVVEGKFESFRVAFLVFLQNKAYQ